MNPPQQGDSDDQDESSGSSSSSTDLALFVRSTRKILLSISQDRSKSDKQPLKNRNSLQGEIPLTQEAKEDLRHSCTSLPGEIEQLTSADEVGKVGDVPVIELVSESQVERLSSEPGSLQPLISSTRSLDKLPLDSNTTQASSFAQQLPDAVCEADRISYAQHPDTFVAMSPKGSRSSGKKGKIGIPFFKAKPTVATTSKQMPMKELQRMIRAGKPSFEQIHSWRHSFETLLNDRFGLALFKDFLSTEFSDENIEFWIACQEYKRITNPKKMAMRAQRIFAEFIAVQATREVNLDSKTRLQTEADLANPTPHTLDNAQKRIQALMEKDSYRRFLRSDVYLTLYSEAREVAKAAAASALAASLQEASSELDGAVLNLVTCTSSQSAFGFRGTHLPSPFSGASAGTGLNLPGVAAAAACADAGMNNVQDLQLLGLSTSRHMRNLPSQTKTTSTSGGSVRKTQSPPTNPDQDTSQCSEIMER